MKKLLLISLPLIALAACGDSGDGQDVAVPVEATTTTAQVVATTTTTPPEPWADLLDEYGGNPDVYARLYALTDCAELQAEFDRASASFDQGDRRGLGYMEAADKVMQDKGCY